MTEQTEQKVCYKLRFMQRNYMNPPGVDWYPETSGARIFYGLNELVEHCKLMNVKWNGDVIYWVGVHEAIERNQKTKDGKPIYRAGKLLREIHPAQFDEVEAIPDPI